MSVVIKGYPDYSIDEQGNVYTLRGSGRYLKPAKSRKLKPQLLPNGYLAVYLRSAAGAKQIKYVHRLVAEAYLPESHLPQVNHKDSDKTNNNLTNLEWCTPKYNMTHLVESGNHPQSIEVSLINDGNVVIGKSARHAAKLAGISLASVNNLKSGLRSQVNGWSLYDNRI